MVSDFLCRRPSFLCCPLCVCPSFLFHEISDLSSIFGVNNANLGPIIAIVVFGIVIDLVLLYFIAQEFFGNRRHYRVTPPGQNFYQDRLSQGTTNIKERIRNAYHRYAHRLQENI